MGGGRGEARGCGGGARGAACSLPGCGSGLRTVCVAGQGLGRPAPVSSRVLAPSVLVTRARLAQMFLSVAIATPAGARHRRLQSDGCP